MRTVRKIIPLMPLVAGLTPLFASAATVLQVLTMVDTLVNYLIPLLMTLAIAVFLYGVVKYITAGGDAEKEKVARGYLIYGIIGLFVLVAFWGLVTILTSTFGITEGTTPVTPQTTF